MVGFSNSGLAPKGPRIRGDDVRPIDTLLMARTNCHSRGSGDPMESSRGYKRNFTKHENNKNNINHPLHNWICISL